MSSNLLTRLGFLLVFASSPIEAEAAGAIDRGEPIASWRDRHKIKTGTTLDGWYG